MSDKSNFEVSEGKRKAVIGWHILRNLDETARDGVEERVNKIADSYVGRDASALTVLLYAAEKGKFDEYAGRLEEQYNPSLTVK